MTFPLDASLLANAPTAIPLWFFDEEKGYWIEDGQATLVGNEYKGEVSHFTFWNCDAPFPLLNTCIKVVDSNGNPMANTFITINASSLATTSSSITNEDGEVCGKIPANVSFTVNVLDPCGNIVASEVKGPYNSDTNFNIILTNSISNQTITGTLNDCNNLAVTNGYIIYRQGNLSRTTPVIGGTYSFSFLDCANASNSFTIEGVDINSAQSSGEITFLSTPPMTNFSTIFTCNTLSEYIEYSIDGIPKALLVSEMSALVIFGFSHNIFLVSSTDINNYQSNSIIFNTPLTGTYTFSNGDIGFDLENVNIDYNQPVGLQATLNLAPNIGGYHSGTFGGTYTDSSTGNVRTLNGSFRGLRTN